MDRVEDEVFLDGFVLIFKNWKALGKSQKVNLRKGRIEILRWTKLNLKGVQCLDNLNISRIKIGSFGSMDLSLLVTSKRPPDLARSARVQMSYTAIRKAFVKSVEESISGMDGTATKRDWTSRCNQCSFQNFVDYTTCVGCHSAQLNIYPVDIEEFGDRFRGHFQRKMARLEYDFKMCAMELGQNVPFDDARLWSKLFDFECADEIVIHLARDFSQDGKCLLWNREKVFDLFGGPQTEFYPCLTFGHGNFTFDFRSKKRLNISDDDIVTQTIKFYTDPFKEIHKIKGTPFKMPAVQRVLTDTLKRMSRMECKPTKPEDILRCINIIKTSFEEYSLRNKTTARCEVILSSQEPGDACMREFYLYFDNLFGTEKKNLLSRCNMEIFLEQIENSVLRAANTLEQLIKEAIADPRSRYLPYVMSVANLNLAAACEMLISFGIYGKLDYHPHGGEKYNHDMKIQLGLLPSTFNKTCAAFQSVKFSNFLHVHHGKLTYSGPFCLTDNVYFGLHVDMGKDLDFLDDLNTLLANLKACDHPSIDYFEEISSIVWTALANYSSKEIFSNRPFDRITTNEVRSAASSVLFTFQNTFDFVKYLTSNVEICQVSIRQLMEAIKDSTSRPVYKAFKEHLCGYIERKLWTGKLALLYRIQTNTYLLVLPYFGIEEYGFSVLSDNQQQQLVRLYNLAAYKKFRRREFDYAVVAKDMLSRADAVGWESESTADRILWKMFIKTIEKTFIVN